MSLSSHAANNVAICPLAGRLVTADEVANYLGIDVRTLRRWRTERLFPQPVRVKGAIRFVGSEIADWVETQMIRRTKGEASLGNT